MKTCRRCGETKPLTEFPMCRGRPRARCKPCHTRDACEWQAKNRDKATANGRRWRERHPPPPAKFPPAKSDEERLERRREARRRWLVAHPDKMQHCRTAWAEANKPRLRASVRRRQARRRNATPKWADKTAILSFYVRAEMLTQQTGIPHEVDHIIPLQGRNVCGLHWEANLQVLPRRTNRVKHNRFEV